MFRRNGLHATSWSSSQSKELKTIIPIDILIFISNSVIISISNSLIISIIPWSKNCVCGSCGLLYFTPKPTTLGKVVAKTECHNSHRHSPSSSTIGIETTTFPRVVDRNFYFCAIGHPVESLHWTKELE